MGAYGILDQRRGVCTVRPASFAAAVVPSFPIAHSGAGFAPVFLCIPLTFFGFIGIIII